MDDRNGKDVIEIFDSDSDDSESYKNSKRPRIEDSESDSDKDNDIEWIEESSESEPDLECDVWDDDCIIINQQPRKNAVHGYHLMPTCPTEDELSLAKQCKLNNDLLLNTELLKCEFKDTFKQNWSAGNSLSIQSVDFITEPFKLCIVDNFIESALVLDEIRKEMYDVDWNKRNMDLYEFFQSKDLVELDHECIKRFHGFLQTDVMPWIEQLTGLELNKVSATCSAYSDTDYLLVHDDLQEDRSIAFILYLTDPVPGSRAELWTNEMGGALELFSKDEKGHPTSCAKEILPKNNRFVFFKVTNDSYHKVAEVLNMDHCRLSINGWFHTPTPESYDSPVLETPKSGLFSMDRLQPLIIDLPLSSWITPHYLRSNVKKEIQQHIETESEISLHDFILNEKFDLLCETLKNDDIVWEKVGPPNRRNYEVISKQATPKIVSEMLHLFQSKSMFTLLKEYTDLDLNTDGNKITPPTIRFELQRWSPGSYSLFSEYDWENEKELDLILYLGDHKNLNVVGGQTMYVSTSDKIEDALITLQTRTNSLNIVFRDTARIVKHVSNRSGCDYFYMIVCSYKE